MSEGVQTREYGRCQVIEVVPLVPHKSSECQIIRISTPAYTAMPARVHAGQHAPAMAVSQNLTDAPVTIWG